MSLRLIWGWIWVRAGEVVMGWGWMVEVVVVRVEEGEEGRVRGVKTSLASSSTVRSPPTHSHFNSNAIL